MCLGASSLPSTNASQMTTFAVTSASSLLCQASTCFRIAPKFCCIRSTSTEMPSSSENDSECFASASVNPRETTFRNSLSNRTVCQLPACALNTPVSTWPCRLTCTNNR